MANLRPTTKRNGRGKRKEEPGGRRESECACVVGTKFSKVDSEREREREREGERRERERDSGVAAFFEI